MVSPHRNDHGNDVKKFWDYFKQVRFFNKEILLIKHVSPFGSSNAGKGISASRTVKERNDSLLGTEQAREL